MSRFDARSLNIQLHLKLAQEGISSVDNASNLSFKTPNCEVNAIRILTLGEQSGRVCGVESYQQRYARR